MMKEIANLTCFQFEVKSFLMNEDGQGRSYRTSFLYSGRGGYDRELLKQFGIPCTVRVTGYGPGLSKVNKVIRVKSWEDVLGAYKKWLVKVAA